ncbi:MAG: glyoxalase superfamily protein [Dongiaceae bacterium]
MRTYRDAKSMAKTLRETLGERDVAITHSQALEIVAKQFGCKDWNVLGAAIDEAPAHDGIDLTGAIPILRIFSPDKASEFYLDFLGFTKDWEHRFGDNFPIYMQVSRSGLTFHLSEHHGDASPGSTVFVRMQGIEAYRTELIGKAYTYSKPGIEDLPWGRVLEVPDPFGNRIRFCEQK